MRSKEKVCPKCGKEWNFYHALMTGMCHDCRVFHDSFSWSEEEFKSKLADTTEKGE